MKNEIKNFNIKYHLYNIKTNTTVSQRHLKSRNGKCYQISMHILKSNQIQQGYLCCVTICTRYRIEWWRCGNGRFYGQLVLCIYIYNIIHFFLLKHNPFNISKLRYVFLALFLIKMNQYNNKSRFFSEKPPKIQIDIVFVTCI